eukprot:1142916-Pelagomonas_calceolata.AAC.4
MSGACAQTRAPIRVIRAHQEVRRRSAGVLSLQHITCQFACFSYYQHKAALSTAILQAEDKLPLSFATKLPSSTRQLPSLQGAQSTSIVQGMMMVMRGNGDESPPMTEQVMALVVDVCVCVCVCARPLKNLDSCLVLNFTSMCLKGSRATKITLGMSCCLPLQCVPCRILVVVLMAEVDFP